MKCSVKIDGLRLEFTSLCLGDIREFDDLIEVFQNVVVSNTYRDRWRWAFDVIGRFKVKTLMGLIEEKIIQMEVGGQDSLWNKLVPIKVNIFMWRARKVYVSAASDMRVPVSAASFSLQFRCSVVKVSVYQVIDFSAAMVQ
ncbi:hypothetical protein Tco_0251207 [Tanacetum coccineum]